MLTGLWVEFFWLYVSGGGGGGRHTPAKAYSPGKEFCQLNSDDITSLLWRAPGSLPEYPKGGVGLACLWSDPVSVGFGSSSLFHEGLVRDLFIGSLCRTC
ncbi:hypothetical protein H1C71_000037 [Ictidomys tridecemlineatus]|nr:hypothetical protein H1C71_000037 [Ictidomys tridecemlineatus]